MRLYLAQSSSLEVMRYMRSIDDGLVQGTPVRARSLRDAAYKWAHLKELDTTAEQILSHVNDRIHAFVPKREHANKTKHLVTHVISNAVPLGTFIDIGHGICLSTVPFLLSQLALQLDLVDWLLIGMELCGHYSHWKLPPISMEQTIAQAQASSESKGVTMQLRPASSTSRIASYLERANGMRGVSKARDRLRWLADNSASPMETSVYLLLCLPRRLGGYGFPKPVLNPKVTISTPEGKKERYPDLYWTAQSIDVEYESDLEHSGEWSRYRDSKRMVSLVAARITVLPLTRYQLMDVDSFDSFAKSLGKLIGVRIRALPSDWGYLRSQLRASVLPRA